MPVMGPPSPNKKDVDRIYRSVVKHLKIKHALLSFKPIYFKTICRGERRKLYKRLKTLLYDFIQQDIYEGW